jgi:hypothetical protein
VAANAWTLIDNTPNAVVAGGAISNQVNGCNFSFVGGGSTEFFSTGLFACLADAPSFSLRFDPPVITATAGRKVKVRLQIVRSGSFTGNVRVQPAGTLPAGIKVPEDLGTVTSDSISFKIKLKSVASGTHALTFIGTDEAGRKRAATLTLIIQ